MAFVRLRWLALVALCMALCACKTDLFAGLPEAEGNQMLALLRSHEIEAEKIVEKGGTVALRVERGAFVDAIELLRQNGFPKPKQVSMNDVFPTGQLVTSPAQEKAKMTYLKEQQLNTIIGSMDGVIAANVSIGQSVEDAAQRADNTSAAVFVKYSPEVNMTNREADIRRLLLDSVPNVVPERISVVLQASTFRYAPPARPALDPTARAFEWAERNVVLALALIGALVALLTFVAMLGVRALGRRRTA